MSDIIITHEQLMCNKCERQLSVWEKFESQIIDNEKETTLSFRCYSCLYDDLRIESAKQQYAKDQLKEALIAGLRRE